MRTMAQRMQDDEDHRQAMCGLTFDVREVYELVECSTCGAQHHNGEFVSLPLCEHCFDDFIGGD